jgi:hypothetical protein
MKKNPRAQLLTWWYVSIGAAFALLALRSLIRGDRAWAVAIRLAIGIGFVALALGTSRGSAR